MKKLLPNLSSTRFCRAGMPCGSLIKPAKMGPEKRLLLKSRKVREPARPPISLGTLPVSKLDERSSVARFVSEPICDDRPPRIDWPLNCKPTTRSPLPHVMPVHVVEETDPMEEHTLGAPKSQLDSVDALVPALCQAL